MITLHWTIFQDFFHDFPLLKENFVSWNYSFSLVPEQGPMHMKCPLSMSVLFLEVEPMRVSKIPSTFADTGPFLYIWA